MLQPVVWVFALLVLAVLARSAKRRKRRLWAAIVVLYLFSNSFLFHEVHRLWEVDPPDLQPNKTYAVGVVLGGFAAYDPQEDMVTFYGHSGRLWHGVKLYHQGVIDKLLISSGSGKLVEKDVREADFLFNFLIESGVPAEDIIVENNSRNTRENALYSADILDKQYPNETVLLITSASHMRRSRACFAKAGVDFDIYPVARATGPRKFYFDHLFLPESSTLWGWDMLLHEMMGMLTYKVIGYA